MTSHSNSINSLSSDQINNFMQSNQEKFFSLKQLNLPKGQYMVIGSGPLGIRNLKMISDIDILVTQSLWNELAGKYGVTREGEMRKIVFPGGIIEAFLEDPYYAEFFSNRNPPQMAHAEIIEDLPFDRMENILYFKRQRNLDKDSADIFLIEEWIRAQHSASN